MQGRLGRHGIGIVTIAFLLPVSVFTARPVAAAVGSCSSSTLGRTGSLPASPPRMAITRGRVESRITRRAGDHGAKQCTADTAHKPVQVKIDDVGFYPTHVEIPRGTTLAWVNGGIMPYQIVGADLAREDSNFLPTGPRLHRARHLHRPLRPAPGHDRHPHRDVGVALRDPRLASRKMRSGG